MRSIGGQKHHYIPELYLKQWAGTDGRLYEYARPHNKVKAQMKHSGGTGIPLPSYPIPSPSSRNDVA